MPEPRRILYVTGLWDGYGSAQAVVIGHTGFKNWFIRVHELKLNNFQLEAVITKYVEDHPELWHISANAVCINALAETYKPK